MSLIAPSILNADFLHLHDQIKIINRSEADWVHLDIMDGVYVPNISFGFPIVQAVRSVSTKPMDVHLMIVHPEKYIKEFAESGAFNITVHYEACTHLHSTIQIIKDFGIKAGVALNPHTDVSLLKPILADLDLVLIMTVNPGYGGQQFIDFSYKKIKELRRMSEDYNPDLLIQVDGGITLDNIGILKKTGVDVFVAGTFVFKSEDPVRTIRALKEKL
jgi:ribulose-phosphate 3-epimerase